MIVIFNSNILFIAGSLYETFTVYWFDFFFYFLQNTLLHKK